MHCTLCVLCWYIYVSNRLSFYSTATKKNENKIPFSQLPSLCCWAGDSITQHCRCCRFRFALRHARISQYESGTRQDRGDRRMKEWNFRLAFHLPKKCCIIKEILICSSIHCVCVCPVLLYGGCCCCSCLSGLQCSFAGFNGFYLKTTKSDTQCSFHRLNRIEGTKRTSTQRYTIRGAYHHVARARCTSARVCVRFS